jgi:glucose-1-phosphate adenylyltransferase
MSTKNRTETDLARETVALILAGGNGTRLGELTRWQCKPAIPFAGHCRNIDFTLSNCVNSGVRRIAVLTQYKAQSLINHIGAGWSFLARPLGEFVEVWPAQQRLHTSWYVGTADAVHQNLDQLLAQRSRYTLVLAGDHVYKMDYRRLLEQHVATGADVTVACVPVPVEESAAFGVLGVDERQRVRSFIEKPQPSSLGSSGQRTVLASMVFTFSTPATWISSSSVTRWKPPPPTTLVGTFSLELFVIIMSPPSPSSMPTDSRAIGGTLGRWMRTGRRIWSCWRLSPQLSCMTPPGRF